MNKMPVGGLSLIVRTVATIATCAWQGRNSSVFLAGHFLFRLPSIDYEQKGTPALAQC